MLLEFYGKTPAVNHFAVRSDVVKHPVFRLNLAFEPLILTNSNTLKYGDTLDGGLWVKLVCELSYLWNRLSASWACEGNSTIFETHLTRLNFQQRSLLLLTVSAILNKLDRSCGTVSGLSIWIQSSERFYIPLPSTRALHLRRMSAVWHRSQLQRWLTSRLVNKSQASSRAGHITSSAALTKTSSAHTPHNRCPHCVCLTGGLSVRWQKTHLYLSSGGRTKCGNVSHCWWRLSDATLVESKYPLLSAISSCRIQAPLPAKL